MAAISRILLPVDFSSRSLGAARYAAALADHYHAELTVLHVLEPFHWAPANAWEYDAGVQEEAGRAFAEQKRRELDAYGQGLFADVNVKRVMVAGNPAEMIVQQSRNDGTGLIVMPTRGCGPFRRFLIGSVTSKVLHDATCPVWTGVHMEETSQEEWKAVRNVLCAVDDSPEAPNVLKWAADFAAEFGSRLTIVRAVPPVIPLTGGYFDPDWWTRLSGQFHDEVAEIKRKAEVHSGAIAVEEGYPADAIARAAKEREADLLVIGRNPVHSLMNRLLENAYPIIRESPCPVVSV